MKPKKEYRTMVRLSNEEWELLQRLADKLGTSASGYLRLLIHKPEIGKSLLDEVMAEKGEKDESKTGIGY
jgi:predicted DNA-binding protein